MLLAQNLTLQRSNRKIFEDINLSLSSGKIITLKGKNGSGKTSLIKTILNILKPSSGSIFWKGKVIKKNLYDYYNNVTYISDKTSSIRQLSVYENIKIWKKIFLSTIKDSEINDILYVLNLDNFSNSRVSTLSLGEIKKLELLRLIIENKKIWILDEPLTNLDSASVDVIEQTIKDHCNKDGCVLFSTHQDPKIIISEEIYL
tara:strand:- start:314 stop:919 length:606 start_codon:yes stop_codon:yes gene_type:complete